DETSVSIHQDFTESRWLFRDRRHSPDEADKRQDIKRPNECDHPFQDAAGPFMVCPRESPECSRQDHFGKKDAETDQTARHTLSHQQARPTFNNQTYYGLNHATNTRRDARNERQGRHDPSPQWISDAIHAWIRSDMMGCEDGCSVGDGGDGAPDKEDWFETMGADI
ncbi:MAG: hypothetical protein Q9198_008309, partial [Flavoplaca austrocitrina]